MACNSAPSSLAGERHGRTRRAHRPPEQLRGFRARRTQDDPQDRSQQGTTLGELDASDRRGGQRYFHSRHIAGAASLPGCTGRPGADLGRPSRGGSRRRHGPAVASGGTAGDRFGGHQPEHHGHNQRPAGFATGTGGPVPAAVWCRGTRGPGQQAPDLARARNGASASRSHTWTPR